MRIAESSILLGAHHQLTQSHTTQESLLEGTTIAGQGFSEKSLSNGISFNKQSFTQQDAESTPQMLTYAQTLTHHPSRTLRQSAAANGGKLLVAPKPNVPAAPAEFELPKVFEGKSHLRDEISDATQQADESYQVMLLKRIVEYFTGKKITLYKSAPVTTSTTDIPNTNAPTPQQNAPTSKPEWGLRYSYHDQYTESETTSFSAAGSITIADGSTINIQFDMTLSRSFSSETHISIRMGAGAKDPLVINLTNQPIQLNDVRTNFDLDADGKDDAIHFVHSNSGFLALDKNNDGIINNGSELFGVNSGNGFKDLSAYDNDNNQFIDANDSVYGQLAIWIKDQQGNDQLLSLSSQNIGAIYLDNAKTPFMLTGNGNAVHGQVQASSIYIKEDGQVGSVQHIDLVA